ncbi:DUF4044 domain-containing protein [Vagococcus sp. BWB3-3]|uniref:DUF4044 domain-containing protein n=1 Tax=Vagococcus allomyrinae TaxID=2794353 RepID=A0A940PB58_9ENTE|nr:DUF4044 domain-containing protein [Vagococcus allomyrinae]
MSSKKTNTFSKVTKVVVWVMLIAILGAAILGGVMAVI